VRERTVLEWHLHQVLAPAWGMPARSGPRSAATALLGAVSPVRQEPWRVKLRRARLAFANAGTGRADYNAQLDALGYRTTWQERR